MKEPKRLTWLQNGNSYPASHLVIVFAPSYQASIDLNCAIPFLLSPNANISVLWVIAPRAIALVASEQAGMEWNNGRARLAPVRNVVVCYARRRERERERERNDL